MINEKDFISIFLFLLGPFIAYAFTKFFIFCSHYVKFINELCDFIFSNNNYKKNK